MGSQQPSFPHESIHTALHRPVADRLLEKTILREVLHRCGGWALSAGSNRFGKVRMRSSQYLDVLMGASCSCFVRDARLESLNTFELDRGRV